MFFYVLIYRTKNSFDPKRSVKRNPHIVESTLNPTYQTRYQVHPSGVSGGRLEEGWTGEQGHTSYYCLGAWAKNISLPCPEWDSMSCSDSASLKRWEHVREQIKVLPFLTMFLCSWVAAPGVDNNGVILVSVAASLTLTDHFSSALVYHSILSWHNTECFPI